MSANKNILIITYDWIPRNSIAVHRPYSWAKYWSQKGFSVTILTAKKYAYDEPLDLSLPLPGLIDVVEVAYRENDPYFVLSKKLKIRYLERLITFLKKNSTYIRKITQFNYDIRDLWVKFAVPVALELHSNRKFDLVVSTYGPRACHFIGERIKSKFSDVIWLADYRDLWSIQHNQMLSKFQIKREKKLEKKIISQADIVTTVSKPLAEDLSKFIDKKVYVIYNGFDSDCKDLDKFSTGLGQSAKPINIINIVYTGIIYPGSRDPTPLFQAINNLISNEKINSNSIRVNFYGHRQINLDQIIKKNSASNYVKIHGHVKREIALTQQKNADLLLLLESPKQEARGVITGKVFEYMIANKPILSIGSSKNSSIGEIITETGIGIVCGEDVKMIENFLLEILQQGYVDIYQPNIEKISQFSRKVQAKKMYDLVYSYNQENNID